jgi:tetratricopeptide (TPR) repeat protein
MDTLKQLEGGLRQRRHQGRAWLLTVVLAPILLLVSPPSHSFSFVPTTDEFATWPPYCKAVYETVDYLRTRQFSEQVSQADIDHWKAALGPTFQGLWHYCAALVEYNRALTATTPQERALNLNDALQDTLFNYQRLGPNDPLAPEITSFYAQMQMENGHKDDAIRTLQDFIEVRPDADRPYLILSAMIRRSGNVQDAVALLEKGNKATNFHSAEINYTLGLMYFDRGEFAPARECAERAYALGYPLPGLKKRLTKAGEWPQASPN